MIRLHLGNVGSGKTLSTMKEIIENPQNMYYSNIIPKINIPNMKTIQKEQIIKKEITGKKRNGEETYKLSLNSEFWKQQPKPINIVLDEFHAFMNSRKSMSKMNIVLSDFLSLIRRAINSPLQEGELILITQFLGRIDVNAREMAQQIRYFREHYIKQCKSHGIIFNYYNRSYWENSDIPKDKKNEFCPICRKPLFKSNQLIEVWHFSGDSGRSAEENFYYWKYKNFRSYYSHYYIRDSWKYYNCYDTFQWDNLFMDV